MRQNTAILCLILLIGAAAGVVFLRPGTPVAPPAGPAPAQQDAPIAVRDFPIPAFSETPYLNTGPDAHPVGSAACAACHAEKHKSYALTAHSTALADVSPADEPPDGAFEHKLSGRSNRVYRRGGELRHEEVLRTAEGREIARIDLPVRYRVGSGHFTRGRLAVTWRELPGRRQDGEGGPGVRAVAGDPPLPARHALRPRRVLPPTRGRATCQGALREGAVASTPPPELKQLTASRPRPRPLRR